MGVINQYALDNRLSEINLNLGCGGRPINGWINIDNYDYEEGDHSRSGSDYDIKMDLKDLDVIPNTVDQILLVHVLEHFVRWETLDLLQYFRTLLRPKGRLIVEMPDFWKCIELVLQGKDAPHITTPLGPMNMGMTQFYGNQWDRLDYETHRYVWGIDEFTNALTERGYRVLLASHEAQWHLKGRDMLVVAEAT